MTLRECDIGDLVIVEVNGEERLIQVGASACRDSARTYNLFDIVTHQPVPYSFTRPDWTQAFGYIDADTPVVDVVERSPWRRLSKGERRLQEHEASLDPLAGDP